MPEPHILLTRIDNRLVHGQIAVTWTQSLGANLIVVVDDEVAESEVEQGLMRMSGEASGAELRFFSIQKTIDIIHKAADRQKIFIVCRTPQIVLKLIEGGVPIKNVDIGNMHFAEGKKSITKRVYVGKDDIKAICAIRDAGVDIYIQNLPNDSHTSVADWKPE